MHISHLYPDYKDDIIIRGVTCNSKQVRKNYIFVAIKGKKHNGNRYIQEALNNGACLIVCNKHKLDSKFIYNKYPKREFIRLLQIFFGYSPKLYTVGITGTDGKTTTATLLRSIFNSIHESAYIGTNGIEYLDKHIKTKNTTPSPELLYSALQVFKKHSIHDLVMEVSSEGILDERTYQMKFHGAIFTNLTHEHLNTHKTMNSYFLCKAKLFESLPKDGLLVFNADEPYSSRIPFYTQARMITYGFNEGDYKIKSFSSTLEGSTFCVEYKGTEIGEFHIHLFGKYNIYNALACIAYTYELGIPTSIIQQGLQRIKQVDGRFMVYNQHQRCFIVDYAHTPNALKCLLDNLNEFKKKRIILILGSQGEKDVSKRKIMGYIACNLADITIFTSEDPKNESLFKIFNDLTKNVKTKDYYLTLSREDAVKLAYRISSEGDIILIIGKGNEQTETIGNYVFHHSDLQIIKDALDS